MNTTKENIKEEMTVTSVDDVLNQFHFACAHEIRLSPFFAFCSKMKHVLILGEQIIKTCTCLSKQGHSRPHFCLVPELVVPTGFLSKHLIENKRSSLPVKYRVGSGCCDCLHNYTWGCTKSAIVWSENCIWWWLLSAEGQKIAACWKNNLCVRERYGWGELRIKQWRVR